VHQVGFIYICSCIPDSHPHRTITTKCRKNTAISPDDGPMVARNMYRLIHILRINCAPSWFYLHMLLHTRQSSTQNNDYQVSQKHSYFSWWWAHGCSKHVQINTYTKNKLCTKLVYLQDYTRHLKLELPVNKRDSNEVLPEYEPGALPLSLRQ